MKKNKKHRKTKLRRQRQQQEEIRQTKEKGTMKMEQQQKNVNADKIRELMEKEAYAEAINTFADILAEGKEPPESTFGDIARAYFELGDYERAADWITMTLTRTPEHIDVRILLARICQREKRIEDALKIYDNLIAVQNANLTDDQRREIDRRAGLDARLDAARTKRDYPYLAAFLGMGEMPKPKEEPALPQAAPTQEVKAHTPTTDSFHPQEKAAQILSQDIRPRDKLRALNAFAGFAYAENDYEGAKYLLTEALRLDPGSSETLRNMALLLHEMGEQDKALRIAAQMRRTDFLLLKTIKS